jgi:tRNA (guanine-N7-)-methyltransferase
MSEKDPSDVRLRSVRSFVLRQGRATAGQERALTQLWPKYGVEYSPARLDLQALFGRAAPRMLEIGFGAGEALLEFATAHPEMDCIGIEVHRPGVGRLLLGAEAATLRNLRVICHDAVEVLQHQLAPASIELAHIFFPDPWPKKRHHKRRLIQAPFVELLAQTIAAGGTLRLATDLEHYAQQMREVIDASSKFVNVAADAGFVARSAERALTRFERRGQRLGHGVWDLEYRRTN